MARLGYQPYDPIREEEKEDWLKERRAERKAQQALGPDREVNPWFGLHNPEDPEFQSVEAFAEALCDEDRETYTCQELQCVWFNTNAPISSLKSELAGYGLTLERRRAPREGRGFHANDNNRWQDIV